MHDHLLQIKWPIYYKCNEAPWPWTTVAVLVMAHRWGGRGFKSSCRLGADHDGGLNDLVAWVPIKALGEDDMSVVFKAPDLEKCLPLKGGSSSRFTKFFLLLFRFFDYFNFYIWYKQGLLSSVHELPLGCWQLIRISGRYECKMPMATTHSVVDITSRFLILPRNPWKKTVDFADDLGIFPVVRSYPSANGRVNS